MKTVKSTAEPSANLRPTATSFSSDLAFGITALLLASGFIHLALFAISGASWHGAVSLRKPALFGISGGMTTWSIAWMITQLRPQRIDRFIAGSLAIGLLIEVALITMQYWRGVASHFNHSTNLDAAIEFAMLGLISIVSVEIFYLTLRTVHLRAIEPAMAIAIRGGMWLLSMSCGLGIATSVLGEIQISAGQSYELWGRAGVLKFPHGVALHAIQLLPIVAWLARYVKQTNTVLVVQSTLASQVLFMVYAIWQTGRGRDRFDWDATGGCILAVVALLVAFPALAIVKGLINNIACKT